jgi:hypothetical protein
METFWSSSQILEMDENTCQERTILLSLPEHFKGWQKRTGMKGRESQFLQFGEGGASLHIISIFRCPILRKSA